MRPKNPLILAVLSGFWLLCALVSSSSAFTLRVDFNSAGNTQSGWQPLSATDTDLGDSWSKNFTGGVSMDVDPVGAITLDSRDRGAANGGGAESDMWRDFLFANGSTRSAPGSGLSLAIGGLDPNTTYPVTIWAFDDGSNDGRDADWGGGGGGPQTLSFPDSPSPSSLADYNVTFDVTSDASGNVTLTGLVAAVNPDASHNVFINGLEIGDPTSAPTGPTDLALSSQTIASTAPVGTLVGTLTSADPTPGDSFAYALVGGTGAANNGQFAIDGDRLETDRDLSGNPAGTMLSVRLRTTDADGDSFEKIFLIELVNDSDADGLDDVWELTYFPNLTTATGTGNNDADALNNLQEQAAGTDPTKADTDGDGLSDSDEVNVHGSDPTVVDSDGDGISDGAEVSLANGYVTDPTKADTDDDGFNDALEIAEGTDPTNGADFPNTLLPLRINEILARKASGDDWIEIYNPNSVAVNLDGYYLTDDQFLLTQWNFPNISIAAGGYRRVFASGKDLVDGTGTPHTNFQLAGAGEFLAIVRPNGQTIDDSLAPAYPEQFTDISYGRVSGTNNFAFFSSPTPGATNNTAPFPGVVKDTNFSVDRGFYNAPFQLAITSATPGATIRYTTNGSKPSATSGTVHTGPVTISTTTPLRAVAYFQDWLPTNIDSHTYIFVEDVVRQPTNPSGWRSDWTFDSQVGRIISADYEMDARVVDNSNGLGVYTVQEALLDIPSVAITMDQEDVTGASRGIYTKPTARVEFEGSVEYIRPDGGRGFQEDCKVETHGNSSRTPTRMQKHSLRLTFDSAVGTSKLRFPLFPASDVEEFNKLVLRACFTDSWALNTWSTDRYRPNDSLYMRDVWMKESHRAMGNLAGTGDFVHLYVNGLYWGIHDLTERIEEDWYADHIGGEKSDWEVNSDFQSPGSLWNSMMSVLNGNIATSAVYAQAQQVIDIDNYIDYVLLHMYADSEDFLASNGYGAANAASGDGKWRFQVWDQELALDEHKWYSPNPTESLSRGSDRYTTNTGGMVPFQRLRQNAEFRQHFADRVHLHLFNGGALSLEEASDRFVSISDEIDKAIVAESARWGDTQAGTVGYGDTAGSSNDPFADYWPPAINSGDNIYFTREQHWLPERDFVVDTYMPIIYDAQDQRGILNEMRINGLYPAIEPPAYTQHGGPVPDNFNLGISTSAGDIYYTTDGSDPRLPGGGINPGATMLAGGIIVEDTFGFEDSGWLFLDTGVAQSGSAVVVGHPSYGVSDWKHPDFNDAGWGTGQAMLGYGGITNLSINKEVGFGPTSTAKYITTYFRKPFTISGASDYTEINVSIIRDDGAIVYLNGKELGRSNLAAGNRMFADTASSANPEDAVIPMPAFALSPGDLREGENILAIEVHQQSAGSSDMGIDAKLTASKPNSGGASGATITQTGPVLARALNNGEWSALNQASFIVGTPASSANLVVSELNYNPPGSLDDTEFVEMMNISPTQTIDLTGVRLTGITYAFPEGFTLAPLERVVIVKDPVAFAAAYNTAGMRIAPGDFASTSLANGGEEIAVIAQDGTTDIRRFTYNDKSPWPESADGPGFTLVLIAPETNPDHSDPTNWRASVATGGSPGASDATRFTGDPNADADEDSISAFLEYALSSSDTTPSAEALPAGAIAVVGPAQYLTLTFRRKLASDDVIYEVQVANDLSAWTTATTLVSSTNNADGTATEVHRSNVPASADIRQFVRLKVSAR